MNTNDTKSREALAAELRSAYLSETEKQVRLEEQNRELERELTDFSGKLNKIKGLPLWKVAAPIRSLAQFVSRNKKRLKNIGGPRDFVAKVKYKLAERKARVAHGTASFPTAAERTRQEKTEFKTDVTFSILVPLYNTPEDFLRDMIDSVIAQTYGGWELCLADGSDDAHAEVGRICAEYCEKDARIKYKKLAENGGISRNTNACYEMATGNYIALFDHDDILHPCVLFEYMCVIDEQDADYLYCDEATFHGGSIDNFITLHFKPDYAIDNLRANNYICHFSAFKRSLLESTQLFRPEFDGSQDHDMILRLTSRAQKVVHVPKLLYYWRSHKGSVASDINAKSYAIDAAKGAVAAHLREQGFDHFEITSTRAFETIFRIRYEIQGRPLISILIPNRDHAEDLRRCITSIREKSTYDNYEIIVIENGSTTQEIKDYYEELGGTAGVTAGAAGGSSETAGRIRIVRFEEEFNYSAVNNYGARFANGDYLVLLNNDTEVITPDWMEELLMYAQRSDVACVGCKLYYPDHTIQHAGVVIGLGAHRTAGHTHYKEDYRHLGYMGRLCYAQNASAVTAACMMVARSIWDELGGLDESFCISLNDVDFCLRAREAGYLNVFTPFAELYHYESISRGYDDSGEKAARYERESEHFRTRHAAALAAGDPYYNPNFSLDRSNYSLKLK